MASVHRRKDSKYYHAAWRGEGGRLFLRSTKQTDRSKAKAMALGFERAAKAAMQGDLTEQQARRVLNDILEQTQSGDHLRAPAIKTWLSDWITGKEANRSPGTAERYRGVVAQFLEHLGPQKANRSLPALHARDVQAFLDKRLKQGCSPTTVSLDGKILRTALNQARRQGLVTTNVAEAVELPERDSVERGTFTPAEIKILVDAAGGEWKTLILLGYFTGTRLTDACRMKWEAVDLAAGTLSFTQGKTNQRVTIPLAADLLAHLEQLASSEDPQAYIAPGMADKGPGGRHGLSEGFKRIMRNAGLDLQTVQGHGRRKISKRTFHALRHSFTSALANAGVSPELRMKLTGHQSAAVHRGYTHHELQALREAVGKLPSLTAG
jgi:integrase